MVDQTGTNFGEPTPDGNEGDPNVYGFSFGDFSVGGSTSTSFDSWQVGATLKLDTNGSPDEIFIDARQSDFPFLTNVSLTDPKAFKVTGTVSDANNGTAHAFNDEAVTTLDYWELASTDNSAERYWVARMQGADGKEFMISNANFNDNQEYTLVGRDTTPGTNLGGGFQSSWDTGSVDTGGTNFGNASFYPRLDQASSPLSPLYNDVNAGTPSATPGYGILAVWSGDQVIQNATTGKLVVDANAVEGSFITYDNDDYINDGTATYNDPINDIDQIGYADFDDTTLDIAQQIYQSEGGYQLTGLVKGDDGNLVSKTFFATRISFGNTNGRSVFFSTEKLVPGQEYDIVYGDGTPGLKNNNLTPEQEMAFRYTELAVCFVRGSMIETAAGQIAVEDLKVGDLAKTKDRGYMPIRWIGSTPVPRHVHARDEKKRPVKIAAGALGRKVPAQDLYVSRQHRMLVNSMAVEQRFGVKEVLVKAIDLVPFVDGVEIANIDRDADLFHIMLDSHEVIYANGAPSESFYPGEYAIGEMSETKRAEIQAVLDRNAESGESIYPMARESLLGKDARKLLKHTHRKDMALVTR